MMDLKTQRTLEVLGTAIGLGVLGDALLRATPWGLNATLWIGALTAACFALAHHRRAPLARADRWLLLPLGLLALLYLWRDASMLKTSNALALLAVFAFSVQRMHRASLQATRPFVEAPGLLSAGGRYLFVLPISLVREIDWETVKADANRPKLRALGRGLAIATPALFVFGSLLVAADAAFEHLVLTTLSVDPFQLPGHLLLTGLLTWITAGFLRGVLPTGVRTEPSEEEMLTPSPRRTLGMIEVGVVLGLVNGLFLLFVLVQLRYLFGGAALVATTDALTLAQYARRGFFEMATVTALALPFLLVLHRYFRPEAPAHRRQFRLLAGGHVFLLCLILASAAQRMWLYQSTYGLTELRLYVSVFLLWLALVLVWFSLTVLRDRVEAFAPVAAALALAMLFGLHALSPDPLIVRVNTARAQQSEGGFDAAYAVYGLSADGVPALLEALPTLAAQEQAYVAYHLLRRWHPATAGDWRSWNRSRAEARRLIRAEAPRLAALAQRFSTGPGPVSPLPYSSARP